jgi:thiazole tautomerase (transcriptional regulator TenI)
MRMPRLHLISSSEIVPVADFPAIARLAVDGGVDAVHLRESALSDEEFRQLAARTTSMLVGTDVRLMLNDRPHLLSDLNVSGVHLPERRIEDLASVRKNLDSGALIGVSVHSVDSAIAAERAGADYVIAGHVFETGSKAGLPGRGCEFVKLISESVSIQVIAIGGITPANTAEVIEAGASGIAVLSGILAASDPEHAARAYRLAIDAALDGVA